MSLHQVKSIILKDDKEYELVIDWSSIQGKPVDLITISGLNAKEYQTEYEVRQLINEAIQALSNYSGIIQVINNNVILDENVVATIEFQDTVTELLPGQTATLKTSGKYLSKDIEIVINSEIANSGGDTAPYWDGSFTSQGNVVSAAYGGEVIRGSV